MPINADPRRNKRAVPPGPWRQVQASLRVLVLCAYPILGSVIAAYVIALSDQGLDLMLAALSELSWGPDDAGRTLGSAFPSTALRSLLSGTSVAVASLSIWYAARRLVSRSFRFYPVDAAATRTIRKWLPRVLAALPPFAAGLGYALIASRAYDTLAVGISTMWFAVTAALLVGLAYRREWLRKLSASRPTWIAAVRNAWIVELARRVGALADRTPKANDGSVLAGGQCPGGLPAAANETSRPPYGPPEEAARGAVAADHPLQIPDVTASDERLSPATTGFILLACWVYVALAIAFAAFPVGLPRLFGGTALIFFGIGGLSFIATMALVYWPLSRGKPTYTAPAFLALLVTGIWLDNHGMRPVEGGAAAPVAQLPSVHAAGWAQERAAQGCPSGDAAPTLYVAAAGGGIRAAYWTARVLEELSVQLGRNFDCALFAMSGVSGGSLGVSAFAAVHQTLFATPVKDTPPAGGSSSQYLASHKLGQDFFSPAVAGLLFYDAVQRVFPIPVGALDRSRGLENAFADAFDDVTGSPFRKPLRALGAHAARTPMIFLNATIVEDGRRAIQANVNVEQFLDVYDLGCPRLPADRAPSTASISLAAAVHNSARFTYVSPAGRLKNLSDCTGKGPFSDARIVDGGYFENSGAATIVQLLSALDPSRQSHDTASAPQAQGQAGMRNGGGPRPVLLLIRNSPGTEPYCKGELADRQCLSLSTHRLERQPLSPGWLLPELTSPINALLTTREQRERLAVVAAAQAFRSRNGIVVEAYLPDLEKNQPEPPLGWSLSPEVRDNLNTSASTIVRGCKETLQDLFAGRALRDRCDDPSAATRAGDPQKALPGGAAGQLSR